MIGHGEAVRFVSNFLNQMQYRRCFLEQHRIVPAAHKNDFLPFSYAGQENFPVQFVERLGCGVELPFTSVDQNQVRQGAVLGGNLSITAINDFSYGGEVVRSRNSLHLELAILASVHDAIDADNHTGHCFLSLYVGNIESFDSGGQLGQVKRLLKLMQHLDLARTRDLESSVERNFRVLGSEVDQLLLLPAAGNANMDPAAAPLSKPRLHQLLI